MNTLQSLHQYGIDRVDRTNQRRKLMELVSLIDELSGDMGSMQFVEQVRKLGYNIEVDHAVLERRGVYGN